MNGQDAFKRFLADQDKEVKDESNMSNSEREDFRKALKNSRETAISEANNTRYDYKSKFVQDLDNNNRSTSKSPDLDIAEMAAKAFSFEDDDIPSTSMAAKDIIKETPKIINLFEKFSQSRKAPFLKPIYHKPVRPLSILTNPMYEGLPIEVRAQILSDYYTKLNRVQGKLARMSWIMAPRPAPLHPSEKGNGSLFKHSLSLKDDFEITNNNEKPEVYVSRSGRQVKRKTYAEDSDNENDDAFVPSSSFYGSAKKNKFGGGDFDFDGFDSNKITLDLPLSPVKQPSAETPKRPSSYGGAKKNLETSEKKNWTGKGRTRSEAMFDAVKDETTKRKVEEENMARFEKTLEVADEELSEEDPLIVPSSQGEEKDSIFIRRRVTPPPARGRGRGRAKRPQDDTDQEGPSISSPIRKKKMPKLCLKNLNEVTLTAINKVPCPLCDKKFHQDEIENHAATCGLEDDAENEVALAVLQEPPQSRKLPEPSTSTLRCEMCCTDINFSDYHDHASLCIASTVEHI